MFNNTAQEITHSAHMHVYKHLASLCITAGAFTLFILCVDLVLFFGFSCEIWRQLRVSDHRCKCNPVTTWRGERLKQDE